LFVFLSFSKLLKEKYKRTGYLKPQSDYIDEINALLFPKRSRFDVVSKILFPNLTAAETNAIVWKKRALYTHARKNKTQPCIICQELNTCQVLNSLLIQEIYYPDNLELLGTCKVIDALGTRVAKEIFGNGRTFRNTPQCRDIVMQYLCLYWGSDNEMYTNLCIYQEDVSSPNPVNHKVAPRPPCRSFCVQVAEVCANDPNYMQICKNIQCPPTEDDCTPDPTVEGQVVAAGLGCDIPFQANPYNGAKNSSEVSCLTILSFIIVSIMLCLEYFVKE